MRYPIAAMVLALLSASMLNCTNAIENLEEKIIQKNINNKKCTEPTKYTSCINAIGQYMRDVRTWFEAGLIGATIVLVVKACSKSDGKSAANNAAELKLKAELEDLRTCALNFSSAEIGSCFFSDIKEEDYSDIAAKLKRLDDFNARRLSDKYQSDIYIIGGKNKPLYLVQDILREDTKIFCLSGSSKNPAIINDTEAKVEILKTFNLLLKQKIERFNLLAQKSDTYRKKIVAETKDRLDKLNSESK